MIDVKNSYLHYELVYNPLQDRMAYSLTKPSEREYAPAMCVKIYLIIEGDSL